jgi:hypothetical protein
MLPDALMLKAFSFSNSLISRLMFIKNVAGPEFESYAKCMERSDPLHPVFFQT